MWDILLLFSSICTAVVVGARKTFIGHRGERVEIRCSYKSGYESNSKYFCKGGCKFGNKNIMVESGSPAKDKRFSLTDNTTTRVFTVTITDLRTEDEGQYWCAVERTLPFTDDYSEILLKVKQDKKITEVSTISPFLKTQSSFSTTELNPQSVSRRTESETTRTRTGNTTVGLYQSNTTMRSDLSSVAGGLGSVLLVLTLCSGTFLILKKRKRKCGTALFQQNVQHNTKTDRMYEEIPNSDVTMVTSSSNQTPASHLDNHPEVSAVYVSVTNQQPDSNPGHTHSTNQRFSLTDDTTNRVFTVTITDLRTEDEGQYWCAVRRTLMSDVYSEILLLVKLEKKTTEVSTISPFLSTSTSAPLTPQIPLPQTSSPDTGSFGIIIAGVLVFLLIGAVLPVVAVRKKKLTCGLVSSSTEALRHTFRGEENDYEGNSTGLLNSHTAQNDNISAENEFRRPVNTEPADTDLDYTNVTSAATNSQNLDQIYTELNASRESHIYQCLTADSAQEESIYHNIDQMTD